MLANHGAHHALLLKAAKGAGDPIRDLEQGGYQPFEGRARVFVRMHEAHVDEDLLLNRQDELVSFARNCVKVAEVGYLVAHVKPFEQGGRRNGICACFRRGASKVRETRSLWDRVTLLKLKCSFQGRLALTKAGARGSKRLREMLKQRGRLRKRRVRCRQGPRPNKSKDKGRAQLFSEQSSFE